MLIVCPGCRTQFRFDEQRVGSDGLKLRCGRCNAIFRAVMKGSAPDKLPEDILSGVSRPQAIRVVVANESPSFCSSVREALAGGAFEVHAFHDGREAYDSIASLKPDVVLLDVALPSMYGFEVCDAIRKNSAISSTKVILIASIYDKTKYKRAPVSLYGADDYIEKHHIPDSLAAMVYRLVSGQTAVDRQACAGPEEEIPAAFQELSSMEIRDQEAARNELRMDEEKETSPEQPAPASELGEVQAKVKRLARIIVSDIALYNQSKVEAGVREGSFYSILADEIEEGRMLYRSRIPRDIIRDDLYLDEAFAELIEQKKKEMGA